MKTPALLATALLALTAIAHAVPAEINYQGVLTDQNGNPVNGVRAMQLKIYDAPTGGTLLYSEDLGNVPVQDGIYSFAFGANGTSNALTSETIATTNGTSTSFQKVLSASSVVAGSVTVSDGNYTWDQTNGSSNENDFGVAYSTSLRRVTATYYNGAPAAGRTITATYRTPSSGISGALAGNSQPWVEITVNGIVQTQRQKVLTVPFSLQSAKSAIAEKVLSPGYVILAQPPVNTGISGESTVSGSPVTFNLYSQDVFIPTDAQMLKTKVAAGWGSEVWDGSRRSYVLDIVVKIGFVTVHTFTFNGTAYNVNSFNFEKTIDVDALGIAKGYNIFVIQATKRDYGSGNNGVKLLGSSNGGCSFWLINEPRN
jgi:hypothetical protein